MASRSTMKIQFPRGGIIPKGVLKADQDKACAPGEPVTVPKAYGEHVVSDRFAEEVNATAKRSNADEDKAAAEKAAADKAAADNAAADKAAADKSAADKAAADKTDAQS